jgi:hypothetical protein
MSHMQPQAPVQLTDTNSQLASHGAAHEAAAGSTTVTGISSSSCN